MTDTATSHSAADAITVALREVTGDATLAPTADGRWVVEAEGGPEILLILSEDQTTLSLYTSLREVEVVPENEGVILRRALALNVDDTFLRGAAIGMDTASGRLLLRHSLNPAIFSGSALGNVLTHFVAATAIAVMAMTEPAVA
ncbi:MAG TPA: CesT family type III secretion system chaperone [Candidatus Dormibacteraeota bacterium]|nr:CesT family type III secretion system chaperone [Candidatus Dormibacteraeota bacterium]